jgi:hypothetical protein
VSETTGTAAPTDHEVVVEERSSFPVRLAYGVYGALMADMGCVIGAIAFFVLVIASAVFAAQLTPCTSAGGIPCAH